MRNLLIAAAAAVLLLVFAGRCTADKIYFKNLIRRSTPITVWCEGAQGNPIPQLWKGSPVTFLVLGYGEGVFLNIPPTVHIDGSVGPAAPTSTPAAPTETPAASPPASDKNTFGAQCYAFFRWSMEHLKFKAYSAPRDQKRCSISCEIEARWDGLYGKTSISKPWEFIDHYPIHPLPSITEN